MKIKTAGVYILKHEIEYEIIEFDRNCLEVKSKGVIFGKFDDLEIQNKLKKIIKAFDVDIIALDIFHYPKAIGEFVTNHKKYFAVRNVLKNLAYVRSGISTLDGQIITKIEGKIVEASLTEAAIKAVIYSCEVKNSSCLAIIAKQLSDNQG